MSLGYIYMHACVNGFVFHLRKWPFPISYRCHMGSIESCMYTCHTHGLLESFHSKKNFTLILIYKSILSTNIPSQDVFFLFLPPRYLSAFCILYCLHAWMHTCTQTLIHRFLSSSARNVSFTIPFSSLSSHLWTNQTCPTFWHCDTIFVKEKWQKRIS